MSRKKNVDGRNSKEKENKTEQEKIQRLRPVL